MCTILNIPQSLRFFVHFNLYFPCSCCSCSSTSTSSCFFFPFCCFSFSSYSCYSFFVVVVFVVAVLLLLLFSSSVQHPAIPLASHQVALGPAAPGPKDWKLAPWVEISQSLEVEDPWNSQQKHLKIGPKIVPKGTEASSNDGCSVFFCC